MSCRSFLGEYKGGSRRAAKRAFKRSFTRSFNRSFVLALVPGALLALGMLRARPARASLPELGSLGTRSPALAGTGVADATGYEATYQNPAGLATGQRNLTLGLVYGGYRTTLDGEPYPIENTLGLLIGGALPLPLGGVMKNRLGLGLGLYLPAGFINRVRVPFPDVARASLLDSRTQIVSVLVGAGARLPWGLQVGGGVLALAALVGSINIQQDGTGRLIAASEQQLTVNYSPIVGVRWQSPSRRIAAGAVFRGVSESSYKITVHTRLGDALPLMLPVIYFSGIAQYDPLQVAAELTVRPTPRLLLTAQACWKRWSAYVYPIDKSTDGSLPLPQPHFHDTVVPRVALEWQPAVLRAVEILLRLGYFFEWSPSPNPAPPPDDLAGNLLDSDRHVVTAGVGVRLLGRVPLSISAFGQGHLLAPGARLGGGFGLMGVALGLDL